MGKRAGAWLPVAAGLLLTSVAWAGTVPAPAERATQLAEKARAALREGRVDDGQALVTEAEALVAKGRDRASEAAFADVLLAASEVRGEQQRYGEATDLALKGRALKAKLYGEGSAEVAVADTVAGSQLISQSKLAPAAERLKAAWTVLGTTRPDGPERVNAGFYYARALVMSRQSAAAEDQLRTVLALLPQVDAQDILRLRVPNLLGMELLMQGRTGEAIPYLRQAEALGGSVTGLTQGERANNLTILASALLSADRAADALPLFSAAADIFASTQQLPAQATALVSAGTAADRAGDRARGLALREQALAVVERASAPAISLALVRFKLAQSYGYAGQLDKAEPMAAAAADAIGTLRPEGHFQTTNARIALGWIRTLNGKPGEGMPLVRAAFRRSVAENALLEVSQNRVVGVLDNIEAYSQALDAAVRAGDRDFAFEVLQVMLDSDASRAAVAVTAREQAASSELGALLKRRQEAAAAVTAADAADLAARKDPAKAAGTAATLERARADLAARDGELDARFPHFRALLRPNPVSLAAAQRGLAPDAVLLMVAESDAGLVTMAVSRDRIAIGRDPMRRHEVRGLVDRIRRGVDARGTGQAAPFDVDASHQLYRAIFTPEIAALTKGKRLGLVNGDILSALPFSMLAVRPGKSVADTRWLIEDHALSVVPSIAAFATERRVAKTAAGRRFVGIGAPVLTGNRTLADGPSYFAGGQTRSSRVAELEPLPRAKSEIERMAGLVQSPTPAVMLVGAEATEPRVRALDFTNIGVLLFATHGLVAGAFDAHSEPALVLTPPAADQADDDGLLTASEAALLNIDADWVILSACDTAAADQPQAAAYTGLARAFLFAGARNVVASHWPVRDDVSERITLGLVRATRAGRSPDEALRTAMLAVMRDRTLAGARDPASWAPFMVVAR